MQNKNFIQRSLKSVWHPCSQMKHYEQNNLIPIKRAKGVWLYDFDGNKYLDATSSWWVNLFGHNQPLIKAKIKKQIDLLEHSMIAGLTHEPVIELSEQLAKLTKLGHCFYGSDGANAIEIAIKMSTHFWRQNKQQRKNKLVYLRKSYHGETLGALAVTSIPIFKESYKDLLKNHIQINSPDWRDRSAEETKEEFAEKKLDELRSLLKKRHNSISAIIVEPLVQCAGGMAMHSKNYLIGLAKMCQEFDVHLIADEIAVGFGRTGSMFAFQQAKIIPDFLCLSKGLTGGYLPLSVVLTTKTIYQAFYHNDTRQGFLHSHSYTGNPLACAAALATLSIFKNKKIIQSNRQKTKMINALLTDLKTLPIHNLRNLGMIWAFEIDKKINPEKILKYCHQHGLLIRPIGLTFYLMPPYCIKESEAKFMLDVLTRGIRNAS
ncbi:MAG: adenosylmethionine--8-amino-7-oxononanoate transaminase [Proteobacteria bacterium]|jgi:adenosylmethionine-8-amino-7-oxononanoate aminotransferase|nr:adenosylmethionine--8-amino-7-oxononanoate transaminase [Pseudomonadota bacterium]MDA0872700.1 adenosylmethionine--8-amino-7-oxononanoate transaminase [Pseudomonadota bacterium]MDA1133351.1 adenosylmethionine--8-amino-7-oxononanoate transaminase [Pseudomonadota bacterium]